MNAMVETIMAERGLTRAQAQDLIRRSVTDGSATLSVGADGEQRVSLDNVSGRARAERPPRRSI